MEGKEPPKQTRTSSYPAGCVKYMNGDFYYNEATYGRATSSFQVVCRTGGEGGATTPEVGTTTAATTTLASTTAGPAEPTFVRGMGKCIASGGRQPYSYATSYRAIAGTLATCEAACRKQAQCEAFTLGLFGRWCELAGDEFQALMGQSIGKGWIRQSGRALINAPAGGRVTADGTYGFACYTRGAAEPATTVSSVPASTDNTAPATMVTPAPPTSSEKRSTTSPDATTSDGAAAAKDTSTTTVSAAATVGSSAATSATTAVATTAAVTTVETTTMAVVTAVGATGSTEGASTTVATRVATPRTVESTALPAVVYTADQVCSCCQKAGMLCMDSRGCF